MNALRSNAITSYELGLEAAGSALEGMDSCVLLTLGPDGSNCDMVARDIAEHRSGAGDFETDIVLRPDFPAILEASGSLEDAANGVSILPFVNSVGGDVSHGSGPLQTNREVIRQNGGKILSVLNMPVEHVLIGHGEVDLDEISGWKVVSHPQALEQCQQFIGQTGLVAVEAGSTSAAVQALANSSRSERALAIGTRLAAEIYGMEVVVEDIGDKSSVTTLALVARARP